MAEETNIVTDGGYQITEKDPIITDGGYKTGKLPNNDSSDINLKNKPDEVWQKAKSFNITDFRKQIFNKGVAYSSKFYFRFPDKGSTDIRMFLNLTGEKLDIFNKLFYFSDDQFTVPNRRFELSEAYHYSNGFSISTPNQTKYGDGHVAITFRLDKKYLLYDIFNDWMSKIHDNKTGFLNFYDQYTADFEVFQLPHEVEVLSEVADKSDPIENYIESHLKSEDVYKMNLIRCYPISIGNIQYSHTASQFSKVAVELHYSGVKYNKVSN